VCHPTSTLNPDPDYTLPETGKSVPHMQPAGAMPNLMSNGEYALLLGTSASPATAAEPHRFPFVVFSHGLGGSPIDSGYIDAVVQLASQGFVVGGVFHGDARFSRMRIEDLSDFLFLLRNFSSVIEMEAMRPLSLKAMTDVVLAHPGFAPAIDTTRIAGFGASLGGEAMAVLLGARLTTTLGGHCSDGIVDTRIRAAVGYVPFAGYSFLPAFCEGNSGAAGVNRPYLAISGTADTTAPINMAEAAVRKFGSSRYLVELVGGEHELRPEDVGDLFTWMVTFLRAYLQVPEYPQAMGQLIRMNGVAGGRQDDLLIDVHVPFAAASSNERTAIEFYNPVLNHYFTTADAGEIGAVDRGEFGAWQPTGLGFKAEAVPPPGVPTRVAVCRFRAAFHDMTYSFYTGDAGECESVKRNPAWRYLGVSFYAVPATGNTCPDGYLGVHRAYNNGYVRNDSNHRYTTSDSMMRDTQAAGWKFEGTVLCSPP
jgi:predicted dienelactone hydrolase